MNTRMDMMKIVAAAAIAASVGSAAAVNFPATGGNRNMADPAAWGGTMPTSTDDVVFSVGGTFTASGDVSFRTVTAGGWQKRTVFDFTANNPKLTLTGGSSAYGLGFSMDNTQDNMYLKGGVWDFSGAMLRNGHDAVFTRGIDLFLQDGVIVTNVSTFYWAYNANPNSDWSDTCNIEGGSKVYITGNLLNETTSAYGSAKAELNISGGSHVTVGGDLFTDHISSGSSAAGCNKVTATGEGTLLRLEGSRSYIGQNNPGNIVTIGDHARFETAGGINIGMSAAAITNSLVITGGASANIGGSIYMGNANGTWGNRFVVQDGAHATNTYLTVGGSGGGSLISSKNELVVDNAELYLSGWAAIGNPGQNNRATLKSGGVFSSWQLYVGHQGNSVSNIFEALEGSTTTVRSKIFVGEAGSWNKLVVSNATSFTAPDIEVGNSGGDHNSFEMQGDHPKVKLAGQFKLANSSTLHLQVPAEGYEKDYALIESGTFNLSDAASRLTVDMDKYVEKCGGKIIVAQTTGGVSLNATALAASNALLPERCSFYTSADGKTLYLKVPSRNGLIISFR